MRKLFKFLKPHGGAVLAILCVLIVQAYCDLSLPTYTSDIVNVGIQQKGIEEKIPYEISGEDFGHLLLFVPADKQGTVEDAYEESAESYEYDGTVLRLKEGIRNDNDRIQELSEILGRPMLLCAGFDSGSEFAVEMETQMKKQMEEKMQEQIDLQIEEQMKNLQMPEAMPGQQESMQIPGDSAEMEEQLREQIEAQQPDFDQMDIYDIFGQMEDSQLETVVGEIEEQFSSMPETMVEQSAALYIENVYENLGIDLDQKETHYILKTGGKMLALAALGMLASILVGLLASRVVRQILHSLSDHQKYQRYPADPAADGNDPADGAVCAHHGGRRNLQGSQDQCRYAMDYRPCSAFDYSGSRGTIYYRNAEIPGCTESGGPAESGEPGDTDRTSGHPRFQHREIRGTAF